MKLIIITVSGLFASMGLSTAPGANTCPSIPANFTGCDTTRPGSNGCSFNTEACTCIFDNFEDTMGIPGGLPLNNAGPVNGLLFEGFAVATPTLGLPRPAGVFPNTPTHFIVYGGIVQDITLGKPVIKVQAPNVTFALNAFYFGCSLRTNEGAVNPTVLGCTVTIKGTRKDNVVVRESFVIPPPPLGVVGNVDMVKAAVPCCSDFNELLAVEFETTYVFPLPNVVGPLVGATFLDSFSVLACAS